MNDVRVHVSRIYVCGCSALILEEIAIDSHHADTEHRLLAEAQELHLSSLLLAMRAFGENNVQTAKHYGNLGRLYQSMHKFTVSFGRFWSAIAKGRYSHCIMEKSLYYNLRQVC